MNTHMDKPGIGPHTTYRPELIQYLQGYKEILLPELKKTLDPTHAEIK